MIHYKGKGEHSVHELEKICSEQQKLLSEKQLFKQKIETVLIDAKDRLIVLDNRIKEYISKEENDSARNCDAKRSQLLVFLNRLGDCF